MQVRIPILFFISFFFLSISAQEKYSAVHWTLEDGLSQAVTTGMIKDVNGFLWITTEYGLNRFDGNTFTNYFHDPKKKETIPSDKVYGIIEDSLHNIWIGTNKGLSRYDIRADKFSNFSSKVATNNLIPFWATKDEIFYWDYPAQLSAININSFVKRTLVKLEPTDTVGFAFSNIHAIFDAASNSLWLEKGIPGWRGGTGGGLLQISLTNGKRQDFRWPCYKGIANHGHFTEGMKYDRTRNSIWISSADGLMEFSLTDKKFHHIDELNEWVKLKDFTQWAGIDIDPSGRIWMGTYPRGIFIYNPVDHSVNIPFANDPVQQKNVSDDNVFIYCDKDSIVWSGFWSRKGIYQLLPFDPVVTHYKDDPKQPSNITLGVVPAGQNKLWVGSNNGLNIFDLQTGLVQEVLYTKDLVGVRNVSNSNDLGGPSNEILPSRIDTITQKAWFINKGLNQIDLLTKRCIPVIFKDFNNQLIPGLSNGLMINSKAGLVITTFHDNKQGVFIIDSNSNIARQVLSFPGELFDPFRTNFASERFIFLKGYTDAIGNRTYQNINDKWTIIHTAVDSLGWTDIRYNETDETYWVAGERQLLHFNKDLNIIRSYTHENGLPELEIFGIIPDDLGNIWFHTDRSICELNINTGQVITLSEKDGFKNQSFSPYPLVEKDNKGNIYFSGGIFGEGFNKIDPGKFISPPSSVYLQTLLINQKPFALSTAINNLDQLNLKYYQNRIAIETGIIDYYAKGKSGIRFKLEEEGKTANWQYAPYYYTIRYEGLQPGLYRLVLQASNASNEFNGAEKQLLIHISPPFWQTWWFRTLAIITLLLSLYGIYRWRTATLRKQKRKLEQTVKERTAEVVEEKAEVERQKEKSDELLLNILPSEVAEELKEKGYTTAKAFDEVTVLFSDIKGFTNVAEKMSAQELVKEINTYFSAFDSIIQKYGLEKIKTIGDAYIAAGGLPEKNAATAENVVEAAIAMHQTVEKLKQERIVTHLPYFELRIGIHTGPVVAGVVGIKKFQYDIWGDTVNLAARMEQSGVPGKINISQHTYEVVKDQFTFVHRGKIEAKNKGEIDMYFVE